MSARRGRKQAATLLGALDMARKSVPGRVVPKRAAIIAEVKSRM